MGDVLKTDDRGRVVIPKEYREKYGNKYRYFTIGDRLEIIPVSKNPVENLREELSKIPEDKSREELLEEAREKAKNEALERDLNE